MNNIVQRLKENRDIQVAKSILESNGYEVIKESTPSVESAFKAIETEDMYVEDGNYPARIDIPIDPSMPFSNWMSNHSAMSGHTIYRFFNQTGEDYYDSEILIDIIVYDNYYIVRVRINGEWVDDYEFKLHYYDAYMKPISVVKKFIDQLYNLPKTPRKKKESVLAAMINSHDLPTLGYMLAEEGEDREEIEEIRDYVKDNLNNYLMAWVEDADGADVFDYVVQNVKNKKSIPNSSADIGTVEGKKVIIFYDYVLISDK